MEEHNISFAYLKKFYEERVQAVVLNCWSDTI